MHEPVLAEQVVNLLGVCPGGIYVDATLGGGGHAAEILKRMQGSGMLIAMDRDQEAQERVKVRLARWESQCRFFHGPFSRMTQFVVEAGLQDVDGVLMDLGMSSEQVDDPERGFSFMQDGPLDMRMDRTEAQTAAGIVNDSDEEELVDLLRTLGEERAARRIGRRIVEQRCHSPITSTSQLAELLSETKGGRRGRLHPATQTFQALRMAVNRELEELDEGLDAAMKLLRSRGRLAVISFHSMEDRVVKQRFRGHVGRWESLQEGGRKWVGEEPTVRKITGKPVVADSHEIENNPRARSAKLRVVERV